MEQKTDMDLMKMVINNNSLALKTLFYRYQNPIFNFIYRYTGDVELAQDLLQETFTRVWTAAQTFDLKGGHFRGWLYKVALNITRSEMSKKEYSYEYVGIEDAQKFPEQEMAPAYQPPDKVMAQEDLRSDVMKALAGLPAHLREVIILKNYHDLRFTEMAEILVVPESTLKARYHRAISLLQSHFKTTGGYR